MKIRPKTIQIYLPYGDPRRIRFAGMTNGIVRLVEIPRPRLADFFEMEEAQQMGVYFLTAAAAEGEKPQVYVGQTSDLTARLKSHNRDKEFWDRVFVAISLTQNLTAAHTLYLEKMAIERVQQIGRYGLQNGNAGSQSVKTPDWICADCEDIFENIEILLATLNQPIFERLVPLARPSEKRPDEPETVEDIAEYTAKKMFFCKGLYAEASGYYTDEGFVVLAGALVRRKHVPSLGAAAVRIRSEWEQQGKLELVQDNALQFRLTEDSLLNQPSTASQVVLGRPSNGWLEWKTAEGETLDQLYRSKD